MRVSGRNEVFRKMDGKTQTSDVGEIKKTRKKRRRKRRDRSQ